MMIRVGLIVLACLLGGCPPEVNEPDPPDGEPCETTADCNPPGTPCGRIFACVANVCETEASRTEPCDGGP